MRSQPNVQLDVKARTVTIAQRASTLSIKDDVVVVGFAHIKLMAASIMQQESAAEGVGANIQEGAAKSPVSPH